MSVPCDKRSTSPSCVSSCCRYAVDSLCAREEPWTIFLRALLFQVVSGRQIAVGVWQGETRPASCTAGDAAVWAVRMRVANALRYAPIVVSLEQCCQCVVRRCLTCLNRARTPAGSRTRFSLLPLFGFVMLFLRYSFSCAPSSACQPLPTIHHFFHQHHRTRHRIIVLATAGDPLHRRLLDEPRHHKN